MSWNLTATDDIDADGTGSGSAVFVPGGGSFPTTGILDNFNRANEDPLGTASGGGTWGGKVRNSDTAAGASVVTNQASFIDGNVTPRSNHIATSYGANCEAYVTVTSSPGDVELLWRITSPGTGAADCFALYVVTAATSMEIYRIDNDSYSSALATFTQTISAGDSIGISHIGSLITVYYKSGAGSWGSLGTHSDGTYNNAGYIGLKNDAAGTRTFDNLGGGTV